MRFEAELVIDCGDSRAVVTGDDGTLVFTSDQLAPMFGALRSTGGLTRVGLRQVSDRLADAGATIRLETPLTQVLTMGAEARPQLVTRMLGAPHLRIESARGMVGVLPRVVWAVALGIVSATVVAVGWRMHAKRS